MAFANRKLAFGADSPSPPKPCSPVPATRVTSPLVPSTLKLLPWCAFAMNRLPSSPIAKPSMDQKSAERADEPSTVFPEWPPPTTVEIKPLPTSTFPTYPAISPIKDFPMNPPQVKPDIAGRLSWLDFHLDERSPRIFFRNQPRQRQFHRLDQYGGLYLHSPSIT